MREAKKFIERKLPFDQKYIYLSITRGSIESAQCTMCDNCGKVITNMVTLMNDQTKKHYTIGTDCADTLRKAGCLYERKFGNSYGVDKMGLSEASKFVTEIKAGCTITGKSEIRYSLINRKGKVQHAYTSDIKKYFPEYL